MRQRPEGTLRAKAKLSSRRRRYAKRYPFRDDLSLSALRLCVAHGGNPHPRQSLYACGIPLGQRGEPPQRADSQDRA